MRDRRSRGASGWRSAAQTVGGATLGVIAGAHYCPRAAYGLQRSFGVYAPNGPAREGVGTFGYWVGWLVPLVAGFAAGGTAWSRKPTRRFGVALTIGFAVPVLVVAPVFISFDYGGTPPPD
ncbi:hypothetical protein ACWEKT_30920 [Nocardia takedensis]